MADDALLDSMRGGFQADNGLFMTFGIDQATYVNGQMVSSQSLNLGNLSPGAQAALGQVAGNLFQNGPGNSFPTPLTTLTQNIVQNTLDNQKIQTITTINSMVNSLQLLRAFNLQSALQQGIIGSLRH